MLVVIFVCEEGIKVANSIGSISEGVSIDLKPAWIFVFMQLYTDGVFWLNEKIFFCRAFSNIWQNDENLENVTGFGKVWVLFSIERTISDLTNGRSQKYGSLV